MRLFLANRAQRSRLGYKSGRITAHFDPSDRLVACLIHYAALPKQFSTTYLTLDQ